MIIMNNKDKNLNKGETQVPTCFRAKPPETYVISFLCLQQGCVCYIGPCLQLVFFGSQEL